MSFRTLLMLGMAALIIVVAMRMNNSPEGLSNTLPAANNEGGYAVEPTDSTMPEPVTVEDVPTEESMEDMVDEAVDATSEMADDAAEAVEDAAEAVAETTEEAVDAVEDTVDEAVEEAQEPTTSE